MTSHGLKLDQLVFSVCVCVHDDEYACCSVVARGCPLQGGLESTTLSANNTWARTHLHLALPALGLLSCVDALGSKFPPSAQRSRFPPDLTWHIHRQHSIRHCLLPVAAACGTLFVSSSRLSFPASSPPSRLPEQRAAVSLLITAEPRPPSCSYPFALLCFSGWHAGPAQRRTPVRITRIARPLLRHSNLVLCGSSLVRTLSCILSSSSVNSDVAAAHGSSL